MTIESRQEPDTDRARVTADVRTKVRKLVGAMALCKPASIEPSARLKEDLGYDSIRLLDLVIALEETFALREIRLEDSISIETVAEIESLVLRTLVDQEEG